MVLPDPDLYPEEELVQAMSNYRRQKEIITTVAQAIFGHNREQEKKTASVEPNMLENMWNQQVEFVKLLQEKRNFPTCPVDITSKQGQKTLDDIAFHMMKELFEACQHLKNSKSHRATEIKEFDREAYKEEMVDALHLFFEKWLMAGFTLQEMYEKYMWKGDVNSDRIRGNY
jgi:hypothetical protein